MRCAICTIQKIQILPWVFFTFFKLYKWYRITKRIVILWMRLSKFVWKELLMGLIIKNFLELNNLAMTLRKHVNNSAIVENMWKQKINFLFKLLWLPLQYHNYTWRNHFILIISSLKKLIWANFILKASYLLLAF